MAGSLSNYGEDDTLDDIGVKCTHVALCTADPTDAGTGASCNELANSNGYARQSVSWASASGGSMDNSGAITFTASGGDWSQATHFALLDSGTHGAGNMLAHGDLTTAKTIQDGDSGTFAIGALVMTMS
jgi:hypothetical protein